MLQINHLKKLSILILVSISISSFAQEKLSLEKIYQHYEFFPRSVRGINSMNDGAHYTVNGSGKTIDQYNYQDGKKSATLFKSDDHSSLKRFDNYNFSEDENFIILTTGTESIYRHSFLANYYIYDREKEKLQSLSENGKQQLGTLSPDNKHAAFVRDNNIFLVNLNNKSEKKITTDGEKNKIINGAPDWVYEEEFGFSDGYKWSPDGKKIAFYKTNESRVKEFFMSMYGELYPEAYKFKYPKAGEANSIVTIHVYDLESGQTTKMKVATEEEYYIPRIKWTNDANTLSVIRLNRLQNHVEILHCNANSGNAEIVYEEKNEKYISEATDDMITYLPDNESFLLISEKEKYFHLYLYNFKTKEISAVTKGNWDIASLIGVDKKRNTVYYTSYEDGATQKQLYSIRLDGSKKTKISKTPGNYSANFSNTFDYYIMSHSTANTPPVYELYSRKGKLIRTLQDNKKLKEKTETYGFATTEFIKVPTKSGQELNGYMIKPSDFDPNKEYPLFIYVYGGPESQNVTDSWNYRGAWFQLLAQEGYIVACVDNRGTNGRGEEFRKSTYMELGKYETIDQLETAIYLGDLPYINKDRIGIFGWSYGGFMTSLCLTKGNGVFKMGIAVAPVTNWRYYDTIYTERFMRTPQENPDGYDKNSPINFTDDLQGKLLLIHGTADDNVHYQNSIDFVSALVESDQQFEMQFYPNKNHGIYGGNTTFHLYTRMTNYILENL